MDLRFVTADNSNRLEGIAVEHLPMDSCINLFGVINSTFMPAAGSQFTLVP